MWYINSNPPKSGNYGNPQSNPFPDSISLPDELLDAYIACRGFALLTVEDGVITAVETNQEALDAYLAEHPDIPAEDEPTTEELVNILLGGDSDE